MNNTFAERERRKMVKGEIDIYNLSLVNSRYMYVLVIYKTIDMQLYIYIDIYMYTHL